MEKVKYVAVEERYGRIGSDKVICLEAYELLDKKGEVLTRTSISRKYKFIEE